MDMYFTPRRGMPLLSRRSLIRTQNGIAPRFMPSKVASTSLEKTRSFQKPPGLMFCSLKIMSSIQDTLPDIERYVVVSFI